MQPINIVSNTKKFNQISVEEVRLELRKIEEILFSDILDADSFDRLNRMLVSNINIPFGLDIRAEILNNQLKLYGYTDESKEVLDPNFKKEFISKKR